MTSSLHNTIKKKIRLASYLLVIEMNLFKISMNKI